MTEFASSYDTSVKSDSSADATLRDQLCAKFPDQLAENPRLVKFMVACTLRNRRNDIASSEQRLAKYFQWRTEHFGNLADQSLEGNQILLEQIRECLIFISPIRMADGAALLFARMRKHDPAKFKTVYTLQYWHYMIMSLLMLDETIAEKGFYFINNFEGAGISNTDINVIRGIIGAVSKCMPIRVNAMAMVHAPWVIQMIIPVVKSFMSGKLIERMHVIHDQNELPKITSSPQEFLPIELGGRQDVDVEKMLADLLRHNLVV
mmetsp:Transcript_25776/g.43006  ORF Transcript_25776/g.43006 Transcript_25776/m.43006 type:complete len:263 (-) Transcript_25776:180-968(-)